MRRARSRSRYQSPEVKNSGDWYNTNRLNY
jgi:hypothetical protein